MTETRHVEIGDLTLGNDRPLVSIAGPCAPGPLQKSSDLMAKASMSG